MKIEVLKKHTTLEFTCADSEPLLVAGLRQGLSLNYECATGTCGTCKARLVSGEIEQGWAQAPGRAALNTGRGEFLMCQAHALTDCKIRTPGKLQQVAVDSYSPDHYTGTLANVRRLTHDVVQFDTQLSAPINFHAGQFVLVSCPAVVGARAYSMVNHDSETDTLQFVVKRLPEGKFSDWLFNQNMENTEVSIFGPLGSAIFEPQLNKDILCIAGGSGIAGIMSILSHACKVDYFKSHQGRVYFGVRTSEDLFFINELAAFASKYPETLMITIALSDWRDDEQAPELPEPLSATRGFVHVAAKYSDLPAPTAMAYIAGPPPMVDGALKDLLTTSGYSPANIRYDKFA